MDGFATCLPGSASPGSRRRSSWRRRGRR